MYSKYYSAKMNRALREREKEVWKYGSWEVLEAGKNGSLEVRMQGGNGV